MLYQAPVSCDTSIPTAGFGNTSLHSSLEEDIQATFDYIQTPTCKPVPEPSAGENAFLAAMRSNRMITDTANSELHTIALLDRDFSCNVQVNKNNANVVLNKAFSRSADDKVSVSGEKFGISMDMKDLYSTTGYTLSDIDAVIENDSDNNSTCSMFETRDPNGNTESTKRDGSPNQRQFDNRSRFTAIGTLENTSELSELQTIESDIHEHNYMSNYVPSSAQTQYLDSYFKGVHASSQCHQHFTPANRNGDICTPSQCYKSFTMDDLDRVLKDFPEREGHVGELTPSGVESGIESRSTDTSPRSTTDTSDNETQYDPSRSPRQSSMHTPFVSSHQEQKTVCSTTVIKTENVPGSVRSCMFGGSKREPCGSLSSETECYGNFYNNNQNEVQVSRDILNPPITSSGVVSTPCEHHDVNTDTGYCEASDAIYGAISSHSKFLGQEQVSRPNPYFLPSSTYGEALQDYSIVYQREEVPYPFHSVHSQSDPSFNNSVSSTHSAAQALTYNGHGRQTERLRRGCRLWEFVRNLLLDRQYNPSLIRWENRPKGTFKLVQPQRIANIWGRKKGNDCMTYEKFSRAMRYYYKRQVFQPVIGKRLIYKFGPKATGWNQDPK